MGGPYSISPYGNPWHFIRFDAYTINGSQQGLYSVSQELSATHHPQVDSR